VRTVRIVVFCVLLSLPFLFTSSASALDLCAEPHCQPPPAEQNTPYEFEFEGEEGCLPYLYTHVNGTLPKGLEITSDGLLRGTPTEVGDFEFWVALDDNGGPHNPSCLIKGMQSQAQYFLHVMPDLAVTTQSLPVATPGQPYRVQLQFSNPEAGWPVIWDVTEGSLPAGLSLSADGVISGTPTGADTRQVVFRAREPFRRFGEKRLTVTVANALQASPAVRPGEVGVRYSGAVRAAGGLAPYAWSVASGSLPQGLTLNPATGAITGLPRSAGSSAMTFAVTDAGGQRTTVPATIRIAPRLAISTRSLPRAATGEAYRARLASDGGLVPKTWRLSRGALPRGVSLDRRTGVLSGTPSESGTFRIVVQVSDRLGGRATKAFILTVAG
jgi:hypothetical protein